MLGFADREIDAAPLPRQMQHDLNLNRRPTLQMRLLAHLLNRFIRNGELRLIAADGSVHRFGGFGAGSAVTVRLHDPRLGVLVTRIGDQAGPGGATRSRTWAGPSWRSLTGRCVAI